MLDVVLANIGGGLGILGAFLVSSTRKRVRLLGFAAWIPSNLCLIALFGPKGLPSLVVMYVIYLAIAIRGVWNNRPTSE